MHRIVLVTCAANGFVAVVLGAFGAHGLKATLAPLADGAKRLDWWQTASTYHLLHAVALGVVAALCVRHASRLAATSAALFQAGVLLFSGSLYTMTLTGNSGLGAITPIGGLCLLAGWLALAVAAWRQPPASPASPSGP